MVFNIVTDSVKHIPQEILDEKMWRFYKPVAIDSSFLTIYYTMFRGSSSSFGTSFSLAMPLAVAFLSIKPISQEPLDPRMRD